MPKSIIVRRSAIHGNGVFAARNLPKGEELIEYRGRRITHKQADKHGAGSPESGHTFLFTLNDKYVIDGDNEGNDARWINHSCMPNCQPFMIEDESGNLIKDRVVIESLRPIKAGEELTYDYGIKLDERHTPRLKKIWECRCGKPKCTGTMLKPKRGSAK
ncbi:MAG: SET domain-containing protein-lysine N-methyltransferase [Pseudomonadota bacterium]